MTFKFVKLELARGASDGVFQSEVEHFKEVLSEYRAYGPENFNVLDQGNAERLKANLGHPKPDPEIKSKWAGSDILGINKRK